jgi:hypothetical protein
LEQLRDIVAEHGMDNERLAMKWKDPQRVIDRIVDRVASRAVRGWDRHSSDLALEDVIGRRRVDIHRAERFRSMSAAEIRPMVVAEGKSPSAAKTTAAAFSEWLGFDAAAALTSSRKLRLGLAGSF